MRLALSGTNGETALSRGPPDRCARPTLGRPPLGRCPECDRYDASLRCQSGTSKKGSGGRRYLPYAFTEQGVAMLSSILHLMLEEEEAPKEPFGFHGAKKR